MNSCEKGKPTTTNETKTAGKWRRALPQIIASTVKNLLLLDLGMTIAFPTIVIPVLLDGKDPEGLHFTVENASWFGSIVYICQPLGSILSGLVLEPLGRKYSMMAVNVPHIIGWFLFYTATSKTALYVATVIMGLGVGFMEAPIITYVGEICEPRLRGTLTSYASLFASFGLALMFGLGTIVAWRKAALIAVGLPIFTILALTQVPETPLWLLAHGRDDDAEKALCWLRGWVSPKEVAAELAELKQYSINAHKKKSKSGYDNPTFDEPALKISMQLDSVETTMTEDSQKDGVVHPENGQNASDVGKPVKDLSNANGETLGGAQITPTETNVQEANGHQAQINNDPTPQGAKLKTAGIKDLLRPAVLKPLFLVVCFFFFSNFTGVTPTRPYMIMVMKEFNFPLEPYRATVVFGSIGFVGTVMCMATIAWFRKRPIALCSMLACSVLATILASLPTSKGWLPFLTFGLLTFMTGYGAIGLVWTLVSEVFPFRGRSQASGVAGASSYIVTFCVTKSFPSLKDWLGLHGVFYLFGASSAVGFVFLYFLMPETEGISLEDIENSYKKKSFLPNQKQ